MITLTVTPAALRTAATEVSNLTRTLQSDFSELQRIVQRTQYYWSGVAGDSCRQGFVSLQPETEEILNRLRKYPSDLMQMAQQYDWVETTNMETASVLPSNLIF